MIAVTAHAGDPETPLRATIRILQQYGVLFGYSIPDGLPGRVLHHFLQHLQRYLRICWDWCRLQVETVYFVQDIVQLLVKQFSIECVVYEPLNLTHLLL